MPTRRRAGGRRPRPPGLQRYPGVFLLRGPRRSDLLASHHSCKGVSEVDHLPFTQGSSRGQAGDYLLPTLARAGVERMLPTTTPHDRDDFTFFGLEDL